VRLSYGIAYILSCMIRLSSTVEVRSIGIRWQKIIEQKWLYLMVAPGIIWALLFAYAPMFGLYLAFVNFEPNSSNMFRQFFDAEFVGFRWYEYFISTGDFYIVMRNTLGQSFTTLLLSFPAPILVALLINEARVKWFRHTVQVLSILPHFVSWVIVANIVVTLLASDGAINQLLLYLGIIDEPIYILQKGEYFWGVIASANTWKDVGFFSILYLAAISGISPELYDAAKVDGASRFRQTINITLPLIRPTIVIILILSIGGLLNAGFEQQLLLQNDMVMEYADVIDTYAYRYGLGNGMYSYGAAVGLFKSVVAFILLVTANAAAKRMGESSLF
jgi:putative aldouronate transport system permease protein